MKNPNGYGSVVRLSGNRRRPWAVRKTVGFDHRGYPIYCHIGYTSTREEGLILLAKYNDGPWDVALKRLTFGELYQKWMEKRQPLLSRSNRYALQAAYRYCEALCSVPYSQLSAYQMQECINRCGKGYATQAAIKNLFGHLDRLALEMDIIQVRRSRLLISEAIPDTPHTVFRPEEISCIWQDADYPWVDSILFLLYTGFRISEMLLLRCSDVDRERQFMTGGVKTKAGRHRIVPIHSRIADLVEHRLQSGSEFLFSYKDGPCSASQYYLIWRDLMQRWGMTHTPHECRHTFRSRLDSAGANKVAIDRLMGHRSRDVGERIYTHKTIEELRENLELVTD